MGLLIGINVLKGHRMSEFSKRLLEDDERDIARLNLDLQKTVQLLDFAKYGFKGTLVMGLVGMVLILALAILDAFTVFKIETWGLVSITMFVLIGTIAFGFFSLGRLPNVAAQIKDMSFAIHSDREKRPRPQEAPKDEMTR